MIAMLKNNKKVVAGIVILVIIAAIVVNAVSKKPEAVVDTTPIEEQKTEDVQAAPMKPRASTKPAVVADTRSYTEVAAAFAGKTIQFNEECRVPIFPQVVFKKGTDVLLDNRSSKSARVNIGGAVYNLPGYGYKVVSLDTVGSMVVDCNTQQNVAILSVQQ